MRAEFQPKMGKAAVDRLLATTQLDNAPNNHGDHLGSAYQGAWYGYVRKDLRTVLGRKVKGRYVQRYCGGGKLKKCRDAAARVAAGGADGARERALRRRRGLRGRGPGRRPDVLTTPSASGPSAAPPSR